MDGAQADQLILYAAESAISFLSIKRLETECSYTWRTILSGGYLRCERNGAWA